MLYYIRVPREEISVNDILVKLIMVNQTDNPSFMNLHQNEKDGDV